jgi:integrase
MKGCRPLSEEEEALVASSFDGHFALRDRAIFLLGVKSGFRISELLSLRVGDVMPAGHLVDRVYVRRQNMKKKVEGRSVILHPVAKQALSEWLDQLRSECSVDDRTFLFHSRKSPNRPIGRVQYYRLLTSVFDKCGLSGKLGTHSMRKTFASKVYDRLNHDLVKTASALGHRNINSTVQYLSFRQEEIDRAILEV